MVKQDGPRTSSFASTSAPFSSSIAMTGAWFLNAA
jgi:hypothetical protein